MGRSVNHAAGARPAALAVTALACGLVAPAAQAQVSLGIGVGAVASSNLVTDSIVEVIAVRPRIAPQLTIRVERPLSGRYRVAGEVSVSHSSVMAHGDTSTRVTGLTLWAPVIAIEAAATAWLGAEARLGALIYQPGERESTLFSDGAPIAPTLGLGLRAERGLTSGIRGSLQLRYDLHRFTTTRLRVRGFTGETVVHRVALSVAIHRGFGRAPASR
ncbi:MAG TPA: hypothetical protein VGA02_13575 [Gemmatimonadales bacterium]|jgi:hypothetical protein